MTPEEVLSRLKQVDDLTLILASHDVTCFGTCYLMIEDGKVSHVPYNSVYDKGLPIEERERLAEIVRAHQSTERT